MSKDYENVRLFTYTNGSIKHFKSPLTVREDQRSQQLLLVRNTLCNFFRPVVRHLGCFLVGRLGTISDVVPKKFGNIYESRNSRARAQTRSPELAASRQNLNLCRRRGDSLWEKVRLNSKVSLIACLLPVGTP